jgi:hypothetical protein
MTASPDVMTLLAGWERVRMADGLLFRPRDGRTCAVRLWPERVPLTPLSRLTAELAAVGELVGVRRLTTAEGDYGAVATARHAGRQQTAAWIFGSSSYAAIIGRATDPTDREPIATVVEQLARHHSFGLGSDRWRQYLYTPPAGWSGIPHGRSVAWIPDDYPRRPMQVRIFDARPLRVTASSALYRRLYEQLPREFSATTPEPGERFVTGQGLAGVSVAFAGPGEPGERPVVLDLMLTDEHFGYLLRLETDEPGVVEGARILWQVAETVRPLPVCEVGDDTLGHWAD